ncbi:MAG: hypothetical protein J6R06_00245 [Bacteroidales bacterium]|nr:hypothetical protein [Bacteroidales bacterium]
MLKKIVVCIALISCFLCFADDFNYELLKNPSKEIGVTNFKSGNIGLEPLHKTIITDFNNEKYFIFPYIIRFDGKYYCQIRFGILQCLITDLFIVFKSGKEIKITLRPKRFDEQYGETNFHFVYSTLPLQDYINYFVKDMPVAIKFKKEGSKQIFRMNFHEGWKKSFDLMKPFFKLDNEVQVQFR